jgi:hypothetical protein
MGRLGLVRRHLESSSSSSSAVFRVPGTSEPLARCFLHSFLLHPGKPPLPPTDDDENDSEMSLNRYVPPYPLPESNRPALPRVLDSSCHGQTPDRLRVRENPESALS